LPFQFCSSSSFHTSHINPSNNSDARLSRVGVQWDQRLLSRLLVVPHGGIVAVSGAFATGNNYATRHFSTANRLFKEEAFVAAAAMAAAAIQSETAPLSTSAAAFPTPNVIDGKEELILDFIPDKPVPTDALLELAAEPTFNSLGLASYWPVGRMQYLLEQSHLYFDMPWWATIGAGKILKQAYNYIPAMTSFFFTATVLIRFVIFPAVVMAQKNAAHMNNHMPRLQEIQTKMTDARRRGDKYETQILAGDLQKFMTENNVSPIKNLFPVFLQLPFFMSMFLGLRQMANLPVPSMESGGALWFTDLSMADPYYILPMVTAATMYAQFYFAADGANLQQMGPIAKKAMLAMPPLIFLFTMNFPAVGHISLMIDYFGFSNYV
jgi:YidC/Oxa1 family membrane protein insertase